jgi:hypothetical protein
MTSRTGPLSGRKAQANRNDQVILDAARQVFIADPAAPISAVAKEAGVGISALYWARPYRNLAKYRSSQSRRPRIMLRSILTGSTSSMSRWCASVSRR